MRDILLNTQKVAIPSREPVRVAAVGCGYWGNRVRNFAQLGALAATCDPDHAAADELADRLRAPLAEFEAVLRDANMAGVAIVAPAAACRARRGAGSACAAPRRFDRGDERQRCYLFCAVFRSRRGQRGAHGARRSRARLVVRRRRSYCPEGALPITSASRWGVAKW
jgi:hypothetical protein